jgi:hypothetical protein
VQVAPLPDPIRRALLKSSDELSNEIVPGELDPLSG